ncbi:MAG: FAD-binding protein [Actinomycetota bacterium]|nr:FAD-binding protein [Actinomycetota bacterium]
MTGWRNWAGDQACSPGSLEQPADVDAVAAAVTRAAARGRGVRVAGAGHSFTDAVLTDGTLLSLERMRRVLDVDTAGGLVRVQAGITLRELNGALSELGLALENLGDIDVQSVAGACATGTHGTGGRLRNLSAAIESLELVTADGSTVELNEAGDADGWRAARVSVGALGVVTAVTLRVVPAFTLEGVDSSLALEEALEGLDEHVDGNDHFEFFTFPHSDLALTRTNNRVDEPARPRSRGREWFDDVLVRNHVFGAGCRMGRRWPRLVPHINRAISRASHASRRVDHSYAIFASPRRVRFTEMEYAVPRTRAAEAVRAVRVVSDEGGFDVSFPIEVRFVAADDALLSPAAGRDSCYIAVHSYEGVEWEPYFRAVEKVIGGFEGRPHWGKRHFQTAGTLSSRYPEWERFAAVRARLDPDGRFANRYVSRVLGSAEAVAA